MPGIAKEGNPIRTYKGRNEHLNSDADRLAVRSHAYASLRSQGCLYGSDSLLRTVLLYTYSYVLVYLDLAT